MKIKSIEIFTLEECREYLNMHPNGTERCLVEARMSAILKQNENNRKQAEIQKKTEKEHYEKDVKWIDIKQFLASHKYHNLSGIKTILWLLLLSTSFFFVEAICDTSVTSIVLDTEISETNIVLDTILLTILIIIIINFFCSPSLPSIYNIEQEEKTKSYRRTQNRKGMYGLHLCKKFKISQALPFEYTNIYYCGGNAYICVKGNKRGVYNTAKKKMVIEVDYDTIDIMQDGTLEAIRNGMLSRFTIDGYRIIE